MDRGLFNEVIVCRRCGQGGRQRGSRKSFQLEAQLRLRSAIFEGKLEPGWRSKLTWRRVQNKRTFPSFERSPRYMTRAIWGSLTRVDRRLERRL